MPAANGCRRATRPLMTQDELRNERAGQADRQRRVDGDDEVGQEGGHGRSQVGGADDRCVADPQMRSK